QPEPLLRVQRGELGELRAAGGLGERHPVDGVQPHQGVELLPVVALPLPGLTDRAGDGVPTAQTVLLHLAQGDVHVVGPGQVAAGAHEGVVLQDVQHAGQREEHVVLGDLDLFFYLAAAALAVPVAVPVPASPAPSAGSVVITAPGAGVLGPLRVGGASLRELDVVQGRAPSLVLLASPGAVDGGALAVVATVTVLLRPSGRLLVAVPAVVTGLLAVRAPLLVVAAALVAGLRAICALALVAAAPLTLVGLGLGGPGPVLPG